MTSISFSPPGLGPAPLLIDVYRNSMSKQDFPYVLCIIDMQPDFTAANDNSVQRYIRRLVRTAIFDRAYIVVAQYKGYGETVPSIMRLLHGYPHRGICQASRDDKSIVITRLLKGRRARAQYFKICGVNTDACVYSTVKGLHRRSRQPLYVVGRACHTANEYMHTVALRAMLNMRKVNAL